MQFPGEAIAALTTGPRKLAADVAAAFASRPVEPAYTSLQAAIVDELERRDLQTGLVTMCTGGGMATATIIERI